MCDAIGESIIGNLIYLQFKKKKNATDREVNRKFPMKTHERDTKIMSSDHNKRETAITLRRLFSVRRADCFVQHPITTACHRIPKPKSRVILCKNIDIYQWCMHTQLTKAASMESQTFHQIKFYDVWLFALLSNSGPSFIVLTAIRVYYKLIEIALMVMRFICHSISMAIRELIGIDLSVCIGYLRPNTSHQSLAVQLTHVVCVRACCQRDPTLNTK